MHAYIHFTFGIGVPNIANDPILYTVIYIHSIFS